MRDGHKIDHAKQLRRDLSEAEKKLWFHLRAHRFYGLKFRRQYTIGPFIADFVCMEQKIIIEADGGQHATQHEYDRNRERFLQQQGFTVLRFWNNEVLQHTNAVLEMIVRACKCPLPDPLPQAGEGVNYANPPLLPPLPLAGEGRGEGK